MRARRSALLALLAALTTIAPTVSGDSGTFAIVAWNMNYGKGMTTKRAGVTCPLQGLKDNPQCQRADDPDTAIDERLEERRHSAWGIGLVQRYLTSRKVLGDSQVIALMLTEVNSGACFNQADLMHVVRRVWPRAAISRSFRDNWIVARWGFARGTNYGERLLPTCGLKDYNSIGQLVPWKASDAQGIQWGHIYAENPDPDGDGTLLRNPRTVHLFNAHWPHRGLRTDGTPFFCLTTATITRDFMRSLAAGSDLTFQPRILAGDLNTEDLVRSRDSPCEPFGGRSGFNVLRQNGFTDAFVAAGSTRITPTADGASATIGRRSTETCYRSFSHNGVFKPYKRIDYQWVKGGAASGRRLRVAGFELIGVEQFGNCVPSDHMGTKVRYRWY